MSAVMWVIVMWAMFRADFSSVQVLLASPVRAATARPDGTPGQDFSLVLPL